MLLSVNIQAVNFTALLQIVAGCVVGAFNTPPV